MVSIIILQGEIPGERGMTVSFDKTEVQLKLVTEIRELGEKAVTTIEEAGSFYRKGDMAVLKFTEHQEEDVSSLITIQSEKVSVKRTGAVNMHQIFKKNHLTENVYKHAYGTILMETYTDQIQYKAPADGREGRLFISYTTKLNGEGNRRHRLTLTFKEEISK